MNKEVQMNFKKIRGRNVITAGDIGYDRCSSGRIGSLRTDAECRGDQTAGVFGGVSVR